MKGDDHVAPAAAAAAAAPPAAAASNKSSSLHTMMIYDGAICSKEEDGIHKHTSKQQKSRNLKYKCQIVMVTLIVVAIVVLVTLLSLTVWTRSSGSKQQQNVKKTSWPELVGEPGLWAQTTILQENSDIIMAPLVGLDSVVTMDYRLDRVWIFVNDDDDQTVARTPMIG